MKLSVMISRELGIDADYIEIISKRNNMYSKYYIKKKGGGNREILHPSVELKVLQRWIVKNVFDKFPVSDYSYAYSKGNSIKKNALLHKKSNYILHTDITNFFPSIDRNMLMQLFVKNKDVVKKMGLSLDDINLILDICLYRGKYLVVGGVASPRIANIIMYQFDNDLHGKLLSIGDFKFSRYADDIIVSSKHYIEDNILDIIEGELKQHGFTINRDKTYFMNKSRSRKITGVVIDNNTNTLSVGNKKYKEIERSLYNFLVKEIGSREKLEGELAYIKFINRKQYDQLKCIYSKYDKKHSFF